MAKIPGRHFPFPPAPLIPEHTEFIEAGEITFGVEYRDLGGKELRPEVIAHREKVHGGHAPHDANQNFAEDDGGVSVHVLGGPADARKEYFRIDCFGKEPHYHYIWPDEPAQQRVRLDANLVSDVRVWALDTLRTRLPQLMAAVDGPKVDAKSVDAALAAVELAIERAEARGAQ